MQHNYKRGRPEKKVFVYNSDFSFSRVFPNQNACNNHYGLKPGALFQPGKEYRKMEDGTFITKDRIGKAGLQKKILIDESKFCKRLSSDKPIEIYNKIGEKIGEFRSFREFREVTSLNDASLYQGYKSDTTKPRNRSINLGRELHFKNKTS